MASLVVNKALSLHGQLLVLSVLLPGLSKASQRTHSGTTLYATKTSYENSFNPSDLDIIRNASSVFVPPTCKPIHVNGLYRHGTRFPGTKDIKNGWKVVQKIKGKVGGEFSFMNQWEPLFPKEKDKSLSDTGILEMKELGHRLGRRFGDLISNSDPSELYFQVTSRARTRDSAESFLNGLSESLNTAVFTSFIVKDDLLRFYDNCTEFVKTVENSYEAMKEFYQFAKGPEVRNVLNKVERKLELPKNLLELVDVKTLYSLSAFEIAIFGSSVLHELFDENDLRVLEYTADLKNYWRKGHGYTINWEQACPVLTDVFTIMDAARENYKTEDKYTKAALRFAHAETLMPLLALFGLGKDEVPPKADNFLSVKEKQVFRGGKYAPFAGNTMLVLYHCSDQTWQGEPLDYELVPPGVTFPEHLDEFMVQLLHNELPVKFPFCDHHLCSYSEVKDHYSPHIGCKFDKICKLDKHRALRDEL